MGRLPLRITTCPILKSVWAVLFNHSKRRLGREIQSPNVNGWSSFTGYFMPSSYLIDDITIILHVADTRFIWVL
jgi:hypothetical protein